MNRKSRRLHFATVRAHDPCLKEAALFKRYCGTKGYVTITERWCVAHASEFNWEWGAVYLLSSAARKAYEEAAAPAWKAYEEAAASALKAYNEALVPAEKAYKEAAAPAFARAYINDTGHKP